METGYKKRKIEFQKNHKKLKTAGVIYDALLRIISYLKKGGENPVWRQLFDSPMDKVVKEAWDEQRAIG